jgi:hypothetical protein
MNRMFLLSLGILLTLPLHATLPKTNLLTRLESTLKNIDTLKGYGPISNLYGLEGYMQFVEEVMNGKQSSPEALRQAYGIAEKLFSRYAYRDGSYRSRIYAQAQQQLYTILNSSHQGKLLLKELTEQHPLIAALGS